MLKMDYPDYYDNSQPLSTMNQDSYYDYPVDTNLVPDQTVYPIPGPEDTQSSLPTSDQDTDFAYNYLQNNLNEPIVTLPNENFALTPASLTPLMYQYFPDDTATTAVIWNPYTLKFMLAINYGYGYGGWTFYNTWYPFYPFWRRRYGGGNFRDFFHGMYNNYALNYRGRIRPDFRNRFNNRYQYYRSPTFKMNRGVNYGRGSPVGRVNYNRGSPIKGVNYGKSSSIRATSPGRTVYSQPRTTPSRTIYSEPTRHNPSTIRATSSGRTIQNTKVTSPGRTIHSQSVSARSVASPARSSSGRTYSGGHR
jgi:hypothetical protein